MRRIVYYVAASIDRFIEDSNKSSDKFIHDLKDQKGTDIYLCGGGIFAGWLFDNELIDVLKLKLNPVIFGGGTRLFGSSTKSLFLDLKESFDFEKGFKILNYDIKY